MGELKQVAAQQQELVERLKALGEQVYLANLGLVAKLEEEAQKQYGRILAAGAELSGQQAAKTQQLVSGLVEVAKAEVAKLQVESLKQQVLALKDRLATLQLKEEGLKLFDELVAAGEKRKAA